MKDWMPFAGQNVIEVPSGPIAVIARYIDNPRRSNWSGKTAFLEAIEWCNFGVHRKKYEDGLIHKGAKYTDIKLEFDTGASMWRGRERGHATKLEFIDGQGGTFQQKAAQEAIVKALGLDAIDYRATNCFAQGDTEAIVERTSGERRKLIGQWLELDAWFRVQAHGRVALRNEIETVKRIEDQLESDRLYFEENGDRALYLKAIVDAEYHIARLEQERTDTQVSLDKANKSRVAVIAAQQFDTAQAERATLAKELKGNKVDGLEQARINLDEANVTASEADQELNKAARLIRGEFDGECPVTCEDCPVADDVRDNRTAATARHDKAKDTTRTTDEVLKAARNQLSGLEDDERRINRKRERFNLLTQEARNLKEQAKGAEDAPSVEHTAQLEDAREKVISDQREASQVLGIAKHRLKEYDDRLNYQQDRMALLETSRGAAKIAALAFKCVGPTGVPQRITMAALGRLEERANGLLDGTGLGISFEMDRETKDPEPICSECGYTYKGKRDKVCPACDVERGAKRADELEIIVDDGSGELEDAKAKSGGAKGLIGSSIRLSASLMLRELRGSVCSWATVDEPFGALDGENREILARMFAGMLGAVGLEQAFVVSHDTALLDSLPSRIEIVRDGSVSRIEVVT